MYVVWEWQDFGHEASLGVFCLTPDTGPALVYGNPSLIHVVGAAPIALIAGMIRQFVCVHLVCEIPVDLECR